MACRSLSQWAFSCLGMALLLGCAPGDGTAVADPSKADGKPAAKKHPANRLAKETSPYLLLHAHNPVDWYPWGPEAFAKAKKENKLIFLSIGYSSCYWCHVMERKVFMHAELAKYMNRHFVCIKVDREERPDVDDIYMTSLQLYFQAIKSRQGGGWPLSMFLTPDGKPFAGGTYFPPDDKDGRLGFGTLLKRVVAVWKADEKGVRTNVDRLTDMVKQAMKPRPVLTPVKLDRKTVADVTAALVESHDTEYGGIDFRAGATNASKFPVPAKLALLQHEANAGNKAAAKVLYHTLDRVASGGIQDHLGGGFHRYSTDRFWHVPHFEKMLYDQAQLADVYVAAFQQTGKAAYREAAEGIFTFVLREMTDTKGGFYSALDAETDGVEGKYYVWSKAEVAKLLGEKDAALFGRVYGMENEKRFEHGYVLHLPKPLADVAKELKTPLPELKRRLEALRAKLLSARGKRKPLLRDDKVLTSWNGLMIRALARAGRILKEPKYTQAAEKAAMFVLSNMRDKDKRLLRTWRRGSAKLNAYVDDHAFLVSGLLALHETTGDAKWLNAATRLTDDQIRDYWSKVGGGFFFTPHHHEELIARTRNAFDAVLPSGNAVSVRNLLQLAKRTGEAKYRTYATDAVAPFAPLFENYPRLTAHLALAVAEMLDTAQSDRKKAAETKVPSSSTTASGEIVQVSGTNKKNAGPVQARAYLSVDKLPVGRTCRIVVLLQVEKGWHINANPAKPKTVIPTVFSLKSKAGVKLADVKYPAGHELKFDVADEPQSVYDGRVPIFGTLEIPKDVSADRNTDDIELRIRYQACNNVKCLAPKTVTLKGRVPLAPAGETVKQVNQKLFAKPKPNPARK